MYIYIYIVPKKTATKHMKNNLPHLPFMTVYTVYTVYKEPPSCDLQTLFLSGSQWPLHAGIDACPEHGSGDG